MAALPYIQLYVADYLADTAHLTAAQHGAYLLLIFNYWQRGQSLNNSNERLAIVARMSNDEWKQNKGAIEEFFNIEGDEWRHDRIDADLETVASKSTKAKAAGKVSANNRAAKNDRSVSERSASVERTFNHTDTDTDTDKKLQSSLRSDSPSADADGQADAKVKTEAKAQRLAIVTDEAIAEYNTAMTAPAGVLSKVSPKIGRDKRRNQVKRCLKTASEICVEQFDSPAVTPQFWKTYFAECAADPFRSGRQSGGKDHTNWKPGFEYLTREAVMLEVFERAVSEGGA